MISGSLPSQLLIWIEKVFIHMCIFVSHLHSNTIIKIFILTLVCIQIFIHHFFTKIKLKKNMQLICNLERESLKKNMQ